MADGKQLPKIRTFRTDAEIYKKEKKLSKLDIDISSYKSQQKFRIPSLKPNKKTVISLAIAVVVILLMLAAGYFVYTFLFREPPETVIELPQEPPAFLTIDGTKEIIIRDTDASILETLLNEQDKNLRFGTVVYFPIRTTTTNGLYAYFTAKEFIKSVGWKPPELLTKNLLPDFNALISYSGASNDPVFILRTNNFPRAFEAMLEWERTMWPDLKPLSNNQGEEPKKPYDFQDSIISNNDARVLKNPAGEFVLGYSIFNKKLVIISTAQNGIAEALKRLIAIPPREL